LVLKEDKMATACTQVMGKTMLEEVSKEYLLPFDLLKEKRYTFATKYGDQIVEVTLYDSEGTKVCSELLMDRQGNWVSFNQFIKFIGDRIHLPDLFSLVITVPSQGIVSCQTGIYPQRRLY
jgi:hypothetical protein